MFNEGYDGSDPESPLSPALCADALRLVELLIDTSAANGTRAVTAHALAALFCFNAARLSTRLDGAGVFVPLREQARSRWDRSLFERGVRHLGESASGDALSRFHLEAGIAFEHTSAPSVEETHWSRIVAYFDALLAVAPDPVVALNRGIALAELRGTAVGRTALEALENEPKLAGYSFYWAARADLERRDGAHRAAISFYERAMGLARSAAERRSYERRVRELTS
jgi:RNA polymerase sigma-70 factor (ECF subfamily)